MRRRVEYAEVNPSPLAWNFFCSSTSAGDAGVMWLRVWASINQPLRCSSLTIGSSLAWVSLSPRRVQITDGAGFSSGVMVR